MTAPTLRGASVVVTGGAGFIGSHLVDRILRERPRRVVALDNLWLGRRENLAGALRRAGVELRVVDATRLRAVRDVLRAARVEVVFDLATIPLPASLRRPRWAAEQIFTMATVLAELARLGEYATLVHCSSSEVYGTAVRVPMDERHPLGAETPYAAAKAAGDLVVRSYQRTFGIDAAIVRPFNTYGPRQNRADWAGIIPRVLNRLAAGEAPVIQGDGLQTRDFVYVTDTAEAIVRAYLAPASRGRVIDIASGREVRIDRLVALLCRLSGAKVRPVHEPARPGDVRRHHGDPSAAKALLGFRTTVSLEEGLRRTVAWYAAEGRAARRARPARRRSAS